MIETGEYISRDAIYAEIKRDIETYWTAAGGGYYLAEDVLPEIENFPAADVIPARYGEWVHSEGGEAHCSECGCTVYGAELSPYCPHCGANMEADA